MTPLIDMVFIILIFFIVTSSFVKEAGVEVKRPSAKSAVRQEQASILVGITAGGEVWVNGKRVDIRNLRSHIGRLHAENPEGSVVILADRESRASVDLEGAHMVGGLFAKVLIETRFRDAVSDGRDLSRIGYAGGCHPEVDTDQTKTGGAEGQGQPHRKQRGDPQSWPDR